MNTKINKSQIMKRAWNIFRGNNSYSYSFSAALRRAWEIEKDNIAYEAKKAAEAAERAKMEAIRKERENKPFEMSEAFMAGCAAFYANAPRGTYFGD